jgi:hypothetical protein
MKPILLILLFSLCAPLCFAQQEKIKYEVGSTFKPFNPGYKLHQIRYFSDETKKIVYGVNAQENKIYVKTMDIANLKEIKTEVITVDFFPKETLIIEHITQFKDKYYCFFSFQEKGNTELWVREIDLEKAAFKSPQKQLIKTEDMALAIFTTSKGIFLYENQSKRFSISSSNNKVTIGYLTGSERYFNYKKPNFFDDTRIPNYGAMGLYVFDENLSKLTGSEIKIPIEEKLTFISDYAVDKDNNGYILLGVKDLIKSPKRSIPERAFTSLSILKIDLNTKEQTKYPIELKSDYKATDAKLTYFEDELLCIGFYTEDHFPLGIFTQSIQATGLIKKMNYQAFETQNYSIQPEGYYIGRTVITKIVHNFDNHSVNLISQQFYFYNNGSTSGSGIGTAYKHLMLTKFDLKEKKLEWNQRIPCHQFDGGNVLYHYHKNFHYFFLMQHKKFIPGKPNTSVHLYEFSNYGNFSNYTIDDQSGKIDSKLIFDSKSAKKNHKLRRFLANKCVNIASGSAIYTEFFDKNTKGIMVKISLN